MSAIVALSLQQALWPQLENAAANLANSTTSGFKRILLDSREHSKTSSHGESVSMAAAGKTRVDFSDGTLRPTSNPLDVALSGPGFFRVADGSLTRNGQFTINMEGKLITANGDAVQGDGGEISIPKNAKFITISTDGTISTDKGKVAKIGVFKVDDLTKLQYTTHGYYKVEGDVTLLEKPKVHQGHIEESNVNSIEETIKLMEIHRLFEQAQKFIDDQTKHQTQSINVSSQNAV